MSTQFLQIECLQGKPCCGLLPRLQTRAAAVDAGPLALEVGEIVCVDAGRRSACDELLEVAGQLRLNYADKAALQNNVVRLVERNNVGLTYLEQRWLVERVEDILAGEHCFLSVGEWL
jgi:hypothetical protein